MESGIKYSLLYLPILIEKPFYKAIVYVWTPGEQLGTLGPIGNLDRYRGRNEHRNFTLEGMVNDKMKAEPGEREHIWTHKRLLLRYFVEVLIN